MPDLWDEICNAATAYTAQQSKRPGKPGKAGKPATPVSADEQRLIERALIETLMGGISAQWTDDAQVFILHHWHCLECGAEGEFPNIEHGRLIRRHNHSGTSWTCHDPRAVRDNLPREFQHHYHEVTWCQHCISETTPGQQRLPIQQISRMSKGSGHHFISMRMTSHV